MGNTLGCVKDSAVHPEGGQAPTKHASKDHGAAGTPIVALHPDPSAPTAAGTIYAHQAPLNVLKTDQGHQGTPSALDLLQHQKQHLTEPAPPNSPLPSALVRGSHQPLGALAAAGGTYSPQLATGSIGGWATPSLALALPATPPPPMPLSMMLDRRRLVLVVWDIENVRLPLNTGPGLAPKNIVRYLKRHFIYEQGRQEYRTVAAVTERSLARMQRDHPRLVEELVPDCSLLLCSALHAKRNADVSLIKEMSQFVGEFGDRARACPGDLAIVLLSGDEDFIKPVQAALAQGFDVSLVTHDTASGMLLAQGYARPPQLWSAFLRAASGVADVVLPYGDEQLHRALTPSSILVAGLEGAGNGGGRRNADAARAALQRILASATRHHDQLQQQPRPGGSGSSYSNSGGGSGAGLHTAVVQPQFGDFSSSYLLVVTLQPAATAGQGSGSAAATSSATLQVPLPPPAASVAALAAHIRAGGVGGGASAGNGQGGGGGSSSSYGPPLLVFEPMDVLRLQLVARGWHHHAAAQQLLPGAAASPGGDAWAAGRDQGVGNGMWTPPSTPPPSGVGAGGSSVGRSCRERLQDAAQHVARLMQQQQQQHGGGTGGSRGGGRYQQHPAASGGFCYLLGQFTHGAPPGAAAAAAALDDDPADTLYCTMLFGCSGSSSGCSAALGRAQAAATQIELAHGVQAVLLPGGAAASDSSSGGRVTPHDGGVLLPPSLPRAAGAGVGTGSSSFAAVVAAGSQAGPGGMLQPAPPTAPRPEGPGQGPPGGAAAAHPSGRRLLSPLPAFLPQQPAGGGGSGGGEAGRVQPPQVAQQQLPQQEEEGAGSGSEGSGSESEGEERGQPQPLGPGPGGPGSSNGGGGADGSAGGGGKKKRRKRRNKKKKKK